MSNRIRKMRFRGAEVAYIEVEKRVYSNWTSYLIVYGGAFRDAEIWVAHPYDPSFDHWFPVFAVPLLVDPLEKS